jgi:hypothetical protein
MSSQTEPPAGKRDLVSPALRNELDLMAQYLLYKHRIGVNGCTKEEYPSIA